MSRDLRVRFARTPANPRGYEDRPETQGASYIAHSVKSRRYAPQGMTFSEIVRDHEEQAFADGRAECSPATVAFYLIRCIEDGLVSTVAPEAVDDANAAFQLRVLQAVEESKRRGDAWPVDPDSIVQALCLF